MQPWLNSHFFQISFIQFNWKNSKKPDDVGRSLGVDGGGPGHLVSLGGWRRARSLGVDGGGPGH